MTKIFEVDENQVLIPWQARISDSGFQWPSLHGVDWKSCMLCI